VAHFPSPLGPAHVRLRPRSPRAADRPTPPVSDITTHYCAGPPISPLSLALSPTERARARLPAPPAGRDRTPQAPARRVAPPRPGPHPFFPFSLLAALPPGIFFPAAHHSIRKPNFSPLSDHSLERSSLPATPRTRTTTFGHRSPPLPHEFRPTFTAVRLSSVSSSPSFQSLGFLAISSPPRLSRAVGPPQPRRRPPETPHRRRTPPPQDLSSASPPSRCSGEHHLRPTCSRVNLAAG
jgi:zinc finger CCCH domain-containing protein 13